MGLPGLPKHSRHIVRKATRDGWLCRGRGGRGGGWEYHVTSLPEPARVELARRAADASSLAEDGRLLSAALQIREELARRAREARRGEGLAEAAHLDGAARQRMDARLVLLGLMERMIVEAGMSRVAACEAVAALYASGELELGADLREVLGGTVTCRTLRRWARRLREEGPAALAGRHGRRSGRAYTRAIDADPAMRELVLGLILQSPHVSARHVAQALRARFDPAIVPSASTIQRYLRRWRAEHPQLAARVASPDDWKNRFMPAFGSQSEGIERLNQLWELDSTPADVLLADGARHAILGVIDVWSRRLRLLVSRTSGAQAVGSLLRRTLLDWGVPEAVKTDNGADYTSRLVKRVLLALEIRHTLCPPFQPWTKPYIERALRTFAHDLVELLPGYVGHSVAEREAIRARQSFADRLMQRGQTVEIRMTADELQAFCDAWTDSVYAHNVHGGLGQSPFQRTAAWVEPVRRIPDARALDMLLAPAAGGGTRRVQKRGLRLDGAYYIHADLGPYVGSDVTVLLDELDLGRVYVYTLDGSFICAAEDPERTGISRGEVAIRARQVVQRVLGAQRDELKAARRRARTSDIVGDILEERALASARLQLLPRQEEDYTTSGLEAAAEAAEARASLDGPRRVEITRAQAEAAERAQAEAAERARLQIGRAHV